MELACSYSSTSPAVAVETSSDLVIADATQIEFAPASTTEARFDALIPPIATIVVEMALLTALSVSRPAGRVSVFVLVGKIAPTAR